jgi:hypothetical protein
VINPVRPRSKPIVWSLVIITLSGLAGLAQLLAAAAGSGNVLGLFRILRLLQMLPLVVITGLSGLLLFRSIRPGASPKSLGWIDRLDSWFRSLNGLNWVLFVFVGLLFPALFFSPLVRSMNHIFPVYGSLRSSGWRAHSCWRERVPNWDTLTAFYWF